MPHTVYSKAARLINAATGEEYGDGYTVTDILIGYAEPGYGDNESVVVLGDWNPRNVPGADGDRWTSTDPRVTLPERLARSLERVGANIEWSDEWYRCDGCQRAVRAQSDSYMWKPSFAILNECEPICHDCLRDMGEDALTDYIGDAHKCVTWCEPSHVESFGFVKWEPDDEHTYENGWHPGQDDDPQSIYDAILARYDAEGKDAPEILFFLDESSQFYIRFSAYVREEVRADEDE